MVADESRRYLRPTAYSLQSVVLAAGAGLLAAAALRIAHAEAAYETGLSLTEDSKASPALDLPGRLEAYVEARRRDPGEAKYASRAGQVRLQRARRRGGATDADELAAALELLRAAAELRPLDYRVHAELARAAMLGGDAAVAGAEAATAVQLGPRAPGALAAASIAGAWAWRASGDVSCLRTALVAGATLERMGETGAASGLAPCFADAGPSLAGDLVEATTGDRALRDFAAEAVRKLRPDVARTLAESSAAPERLR